MLDRSFLPRPTPHAPTLAGGPPDGGGRTDKNGLLGNKRLPDLFHRARRSARVASVRLGDGRLTAPA